MTTRAAGASRAASGRATGTGRSRSAAPRATGTRSSAATRGGVSTRGATSPRNGASGATKSTKATRASEATSAPATKAKVDGSKKAAGRVAQNPKTPATKSMGSGTKTTAANAPKATSRFSAKELAAIRAVLSERQNALRTEYDKAMTDLYELQADRTAESSGDDQADTGSKTFEREQELTLANGILERVNQVEHALSRLDNETYGQCERCGNPIPKARLEAFPAATLCVTCKQLEERR